MNICTRPEAFALVTESKEVDHQQMLRCGAIIQDEGSPGGCILGISNPKQREVEAVWSVVATKGIKNSAPVSERPKSIRRGCCVLRCFHTKHHCYTEKKLNLFTTEKPPPEAPDKICNKRTGSARRSARRWSCWRPIPEKCCPSYQRILCAQQP
jgi:hypothetical protein